MTVNFMGLTGPEGVLPNPYTIADYREVAGERLFAARIFWIFSITGLFRSFIARGENIASMWRARRASAISFRDIC